MNKIATKHAPEALGPYSQGVSYQQLLFVSGQLPIDPETGKMIKGEIAELTRQVLKNIEAVLKAGESDLTKVLRVDIFLKDLKSDFSAVQCGRSSRLK